MRLCFVFALSLLSFLLCNTPAIAGRNSRSSKIYRYFSNKVLEGQLLLRPDGKVVSRIPATRQQGTRGSWRVVRSTVTIRLATREAVGQAYKEEKSEYKLRGIRILRDHSVIVRYLSYRGGRSIHYVSSGRKVNNRWTHVILQKKVRLWTRPVEFRGTHLFGLKQNPSRRLRLPVLMLSMGNLGAPLNPQNLRLWTKTGNSIPSKTTPVPSTPPTGASLPKPGTSTPTRTTTSRGNLLSRAEVIRFFAEKVLEDHLLVVEGGRLRSFLGVFGGHSVQGSWKAGPGTFEVTVVQRMQQGKEERRIQSMYVFKGIRRISPTSIRVRYFRYYAGKGHHFLGTRRRVYHRWTTVKTRANLQLVLKSLPSYKLRFRTTKQQRAKRYTVLTIRYRGRYIPLIGKKL